MSISRNIINRSKSVIQALYGQITLYDIPKNVPEDVPLIGFLSEKQRYSLNEKGYEYFRELGGLAFSDKRIREGWSEMGIREQLNDLTRRLATIKSQSQIPNFDDITQEWIAKIDITFQEYECFTPVIGLTTDKPFTLGSITFYPLELAKARIKHSDDPLCKSFFNDLSPERNCLACSKVQTEWLRTHEQMCQKTEIILNILRYLGSLVWWNQPTKHIYLAGKQLKRVSYSFAVDEKNQIARIAGEEFSPYPFKIDEEFLHLGNHYGLSHLQTILLKPDLSDMEQALLTALQWYGDATQELSLLFSFVKFYTAIETITKRKQELQAKKILPRRVSVIIGRREKDRQAQIQQDFETLVDERNNILHSGKPNKENVENLAWESQIFARDSIHEIRQKIQRNGFQTKDQLTEWVKIEYEKYYSS